jgi:hypothetical protein
LQRIPQEEFVVLHVPRATALEARKPVSGISQARERVDFFRDFSYGEGEPHSRFPCMKLTARITSKSSKD